MGGGAYRLRLGGILALGLVFMISACEPVRVASKKPLAPPPPATLDKLWGIVSDSAAKDTADDWITRFGDANLSALVTAAGNYNRDFTALIGRLHDAAILSQRAADGLLPRLTVRHPSTALVIAEALGDRTGDVQLGFEATWLPGLLMRLKQEAQARKRTPPETLLSDNTLRAELLQLRHYLVALIAKSWFVTVGNKLQINLQRERLQSKREMRKLALKRSVATDTDRIRSAVVQVQETVMRRQDNLGDAMLALSTLLGQPPLVALDAVEALPPDPDRVPAGLSATLLARRSDIRFADHRVTLSLKRPEGVRSTQVPELPLTAADGAHSKLLVDTLQGDNPQWSTITVFLLPGQKWRRYLNTQLQQRALDAYTDTVQHGLQEVMMVLVNEHVLRTYHAALDEKRVLSAVAAHRQKKQHEAGEIDSATFEETQDVHFMIRSTLINLQVELLKQRVNLHLVMGGGFR